MISLSPIHISISASELSTEQPISYFLNPKSQYWPFLIFWKIPVLFLVTQFLVTHIECTCSVIDWTDFLLARWCNTPDEFLLAHFSIMRTQCRWSSMRIRRDLDRALSMELNLGQTSLPNFLPRYSRANWLSTMSTPSTVIHGVLPMYGHYHNPSFSKS